MSWLSQALGLDKNPTELAAINAIGNIALTSVESKNPELTTLVSLGSSLTTASGPSPSPSTVERIPQIETAIRSVINQVLANAGASALLENEVDDAVTKELTSLGLIS